MLSAYPLSFRLSTTAFVMAAIATFGLHLRAQEPPAVQVGDTRITGLPSDWSHRHVIYGNPGTEQDAIKNGTHEQWLKIVNDPRYVVQHLKKNQPVQGPAAQDVEMRQRIADQESKSSDQWQRGKLRHNKPEPAQTTMHRDWSMDTGGTAAGLTLTIAAPGAGNISGTSMLTINGTALSASAPTSASETGTFTGNPTNTQNVVVGTQTLTPSLSTAGTRLGTFSTYPPTTGSAITVGYGANTFTLTTNGSGAHALGTASGTPAAGTTFSVTSGANTATLTNSGTVATVTGTASGGIPAANTQISVTSGANTLTLSNGGTKATITATTAGTPTATTQISVTSGSNILTLSNGGTKSKEVGTFAQPPISTTSIGITSLTNTVAFTSVGTGWVSVNSGLSSGDTLKIGSTGTTYQFERTASNCSGSDR